MYDIFALHRYQTMFALLTVENKLTLTNSGG